jgi:hypothetical protein
MALPYTLKSIIRQKKNYGNSNISSCPKKKKKKKKSSKKKLSKRNQNPSKYYNSVTNLKI